VVLILADDGWERGLVALKFQLGDIVFARVALSLFRRNARLDEPPLRNGDVPRPPSGLDGADGYVVWSHPISAKLPTLSIRDDAIRYIPQQYRRFFIDLSGNFEQYLTSFSGKTRSDLRRKLRKFSNASGGSINWKQYRTPEEVVAFFTLAKKVSAKTYQDRLLGVGLPADERFIASACALSREDRIRAYLLFLNEVPISYLFCPISEGVVSYDRLGYDPAYASLSPGTVLQMLVLEALFAERQFETFDFTEGEGQHKEVFSTGNRLCGDVYVVGRRLAPAVLILLHHTMDRVSSSVGLILDRLSIKSQVRKLLRGI
jgi:hypothetical protein